MVNGSTVWDSMGIFGCFFFFFNNFFFPLTLSRPLLKRQLVQIMHRWNKKSQLDIRLVKSIAWSVPSSKIIRTKMNGIICLWAVRLWELRHKSILGCRRLTGSLSRISARWRGFFEKSSVIRVAAAAAKKEKKAWPCSSPSKAQIKRASNGGSQDFYSTQLLPPTQDGWQVLLNYDAVKHATSEKGLDY